MSSDSKANNNNTLQQQQAAQALESDVELSLFAVHLLTTPMSEDRKRAIKRKFTEEANESDVAAVLVHADALMDSLRVLNAEKRRRKAAAETTTEQKKSEPLPRFQSNDEILATFLRSLDQIVREEAPSITKAMDEQIKETGPQCAGGLSHTLSRRDLNFVQTDALCRRLRMQGVMCRVDWSKAGSIYLYWGAGAKQKLAESKADDDKRVQEFGY